MRVSGRVGQREAFDIFGTRRDSELAHHESDRLLPFDVVIERHHRRLCDPGVALQHALDIGRVDVLAPRYEHVVGAFYEIALLPHPAG
jgi:hypothetical protein